MSGPCVSFFGYFYFLLRIIIIFIAFLRTNNFSFIFVTSHSFSLFDLILWSIPRRSYSKVELDYNYTFPDIVSKLINCSTFALYDFNWKLIPYVECNMKQLRIIFINKNVFIHFLIELFSTDINSYINQSKSINFRNLRKKINLSKYQCWHL